METFLDRYLHENPRSELMNNTTLDNTSILSESYGLCFLNNNFRTATTNEKIASFINDMIERLIAQKLRNHQKYKDTSIYKEITFTHAKIKKTLGENIYKHSSDMIKLLDQDVITGTSIIFADARTNALKETYRINVRTSESSLNFSMLDYLGEEIYVDDTNNGSVIKEKFQLFAYYNSFCEYVDLIKDVKNSDVRLFFEFHFKNDELRRQYEERIVLEPNVVGFNEKFKFGDNVRTNNIGFMKGKKMQIGIVQTTEGGTSISTNSMISR